jgi:hypothetical protein
MRKEKKEEDVVVDETMRCGGNEVRTAIKIRSNTTSTTLIISPQLKSMCQPPEARQQFA